METETSASVVRHSSIACTLDLYYTLTFLSTSESDHGKAWDYGRVP